MEWIALLIGVLLVVYLLNKRVSGLKVEHLDGNQLDSLIKEGTGKYQLIDVRTPEEYNNRKIKGFKNIPLQVLPNRMKEIDKEKPVVLMCASGSRSMHAAGFLSKNGYKTLINVKGGISSYKG